MKKPFLFAALGLSALSIPLALSASSPTANHRVGTGVAWDIVEGLTTEVGPRMAGTEAEARARTWAVARLNKLGFDKVWVEEFDMPTWVRGAETADVIAPYPAHLHITALGNSASTGEEGLTAEVAYFATYADLIAAPDGSLTGKIAFVSHNMQRTQDGSSYGYAGPARWTAANIAAKKGAAGIVIRSVGTDYHRNPHAGGTSFEEGVAPIPAGALSIPDAENLERMLARGKPVTMRIKLTPRDLGMQKSGNVLAEIKGSNPALPPILVACHLDSWDLGTGAIDDAAGCGIITDAVLRATKGKKPVRAIRVLWAGAEEVGLFGGIAYAEKYKDMPHAVAMESDFGAGRIWRVDFKLPPQMDGLKPVIAQALAPMGIVVSRDLASGGPDVGPLVAAQNLAAIDLQQDGSDYFDLHHTPDDTLDKIDPAMLEQNVQAWAIVLSILAQDDGDWRFPG